MIIGRSRPRLAWFLLLAGVAAFDASAQSYPSKPVTVIVPFAAGGSVDAAARFVMPKLAERLKQPIVVENVPGAGGTIGAQRVAKAAPDGYTLLFAVQSNMTIEKLVRPSVVRYDGIKDFTPISLVGTSPLVLVGRADTPANNTLELLKLLRGQPGKFRYATSGSSLHLAGELVNHLGGVDMMHVPYKAGPQIVTDLIGGQFEIAVLPLVLAHPAIKGGKLKAFGVTSASRWPTAPEIPSLAETPELKGFEVLPWYGLFAPAKTLPDIVNRLVTEMVTVLADPDIVKRMRDLALVPSKLTPAEFTAVLRNEQQYFAELVKARKITAE